MEKDPNSLFGRPALLVLAHLRTEHLRKCIASIIKATGIEEFSIVAVVDGANSAVLEILTTLLRPHFTFALKSPSDLPVAGRISSSLRIGLKFAFGELNAPFVVVVEDDIVVEQSFLRFVESAHQAFSQDAHYKGVNGFSGEIIDHPPGTLLEKVVLLNYGLGWGWSVTRHSYLGFRHLLEHDRRREWHWDYAIEPYIRTGFVVNPLISKIKNLGFDESAAHTSGANYADLGRRISESYASNRGKPVPANFQIAPVPLPFTWRKDCINLFSVPRRLTLALSLVRKAIYISHLFQLSGNPYVRDIGLRLERLFEQNIFGRFFCKPRFNGNL